jgi:hypothetical protein
MSLLAARAGDIVPRADAAEFSRAKWTCALKTRWHAQRMTSLASTLASVSSTPFFAEMLAPSLKR